MSAAVDPVPVNLTNISRGAAVELFQTELERVLASIRDVNRPAKAKRSIKIVVEFTPNEARNEAGVAISCESKIPAPNGAATTVFVGVRQGEIIAVEQDLEQMQLDWEKQTPVRDLRSLSIPPEEN